MEIRTRRTLPFLGAAASALCLAWWALAPGHAGASRRGDSGTGALEFSFTYFTPDLTIDQPITVGGVKFRGFTIPMNRYSGLYVGAQQAGTLGQRYGIGIGRQDLRFYMDGPETSNGPFSLETFWVYFDAGLGGRVRRGRFELAPAVGVGPVITMGRIGSNLGAGEGRSTRVVTLGHVELPARVWLSDRVAVSAAYHRFFRLSDATYNFGNGVLLKSHLGNAHEFRLGFYLHD
ncbi:MAG: hypothetical protein HZB25_06880 [Candidatus Eisenbacteria bacterium]|nr:hypothetical protein [Candidatus Eisenbacteria bacterium]